MFQEFKRKICLGNSGNKIQQQKFRKKIQLGLQFLRKKNLSGEKIVAKNSVKMCQEFWRKQSWEKNLKAKILAAKSFCKICWIKIYQRNLGLRQLKKKNSDFWAINQVKKMFKPKIMKKKIYGPKILVKKFLHQKNLKNFLAKNI